ncbi:MAG: phosphatidate cytidylyltransferase, partial [Candidatus Acidiferrum sp.]
MTWKRVATAAVLIPCVVALVLWGSNEFVALGTALVILLALFEYFSLGDAIGHRAYRFWTATCALLMVAVQGWAVRGPELGQLGLPRRWLPEPQLIDRYATLTAVFPPNIGDVFFVFLLGVAALTLWTKRPMVEALPAAGISSSGLILVALPLTFAIRLHGFSLQGPAILLFVLVITWVGDTAAYFAGRAFGKHKFAPVLSPKKTWEGSVASLLGALLVAFVFSKYLNVPLAHLLV